MNVSLVIKSAFHMGVMDVSVVIRNALNVLRVDQGSGCTLIISRVISLFLVCHVGAMDVSHVISVIGRSKIDVMIR